MGPGQLSKVEDQSTPEGNSEVGKCVAPEWARKGFKNLAQYENWLSVHYPRMLWIDGALTDAQREGLAKVKGFDHIEQNDNWAIAYFTCGVDGVFLKSILDPNVFVLQKTQKADMLEINFNPTTEQMVKLRAFLDRVRALALPINCK